MINLRESIRSDMERKNFDQIANEEWYAKNPIPKNLPIWSSVTCLRLEVMERLKVLLNSSPKDSPQHILYESAMNKSLRRKDGITPLRCEFLNSVNSVGSRDDIVRLCFSYHTKSVTPFFTTTVYSNPKKPEEEVMHIDIAGLGMTRDLYIKREHARIRKQYLKYVSRQFQNIGESKTDSDIIAKRVFRLERGLARKALSLEKRRDPCKINNVMTRKQLQRSRFPWRVYWEQIPRVKKVVLDSPSYYNHVGTLIRQAPLEDLKAYLSWRAINSYGKYCSEKIRREKWRFYSNYLNGVKKQVPEWKSLVKMISSAFRDNVGKAYIRKYFKRRYKKDVQQMAESIREAFRVNLRENVTWMSERTKKACLHKLNKVIFRVAYPDKWDLINSVPGLHPEHSFLLNLVNVNRFLYFRQIRKLGKKVNRKEWDGACFTVNGFYEPFLNVITIPAGILQKPFYFGDKKTFVNLARNYGALGRMIGHELTHGFDDQGRKFDANGKLREWWSKSDERRFRSRTRAVTRLYDMKINGSPLNTQLTMGENIADLGGIKLAWMAFLRTFCRQFPGRNPAEKQGSLSPDQEFFLAYARSKRQKYRPKALLRSLATDNHSPEFVRVNVVLKQFEPFHRAYCIRPGDPMFTPVKDRPAIW